MISIVIPVFNEEGNVGPVYERICPVLAGLSQKSEIIFINDGSSDGTEAALERIAASDPIVKVINFRRNHGQTAALVAGFDHASGDIVIPMDGDLQNDPNDIPRLIAKLDEGYSVVSGWRKDRQDSFIRRMPSRAANWLISRVFDLHLHDYGCTLKAYRREMLQDVKLYGEMHRFIPIYASWHGAKVTEIPVNHFARTKGVSKYGMGRIAKVMLDILVVKFLEDYNTKPIYVFGLLGVGLFGVSLLSGLLAIYLRLFENIAFISTPLPLLVAMTLIIGVLVILLGLIAELLIRVYYETQNKRIYFIRSTTNLGN
jgi:glycosyltransferase involved in cell wall biosynthesis